MTIILDNQPSPSAVDALLQFALKLIFINEIPMCTIFNKCLFLFIHSRGPIKGPHMVLMKEEQHIMTM